MTDKQQKDNAGALFKNDKREKDTQPNAKGSAMINGTEYWVSAWTNTSSKGVRYQSLAFEPKSQVFTNTEEMQSHGQELSDSIPF